MRLTTWNCKGAFARKHAAIASLRPDILVVPEAEELTTVENASACAAKLRELCAPARSNASRQNSRRALIKMLIAM